MKTSLIAGVTNIVTTLPKARIETLEENYILELREFLSLHGCDVSVNDRSVKMCEYHIIVGDRDFVKRIVENTTCTTRKVLIITWEKLNDLNFGSIEPFLKIVYVDPVSLTKKDIEKIFSFFIIGKQKTLSLKSETQKNQIGRSPVISETAPDKTSAQQGNPYPNLPWRTVMNPTDEQRQISDTNRITSVIDALYTPPAPEKNAKEPRTSIRSLVFVTGATTIFLILFPFIWYLLMILTTGFSFIRYASCLEKGNIGCARSWIAIAGHGNEQRNLASSVVHPLVAVLMGKEAVFTYERIGVLFTALVRLANEANEVTGIVSDASALFLPVGSTETKTSVLFVDSLKKTIPTIRTNLDLAIGSGVLLSSSSVFPFRQPFIQTRLASVVEKMKSYRRIINMTEQGIALYPAFAGFKGAEKVLFLLQNASELRPTGGFIGSVARANITDGKIQEFAIHDVYTFDGQLKGHVDPPQTLKDAWGQEHWYLRDSNWSPDFPESARSALWFFEKETGERVDSVIAVSTSFLVRLLSITGPIDVPEYNDRISASNFYAKSLFYTQTDFFPGSTQKKDFLGALSTSLLTKIQSGKETYAVGIARAVTESLLSRDILLYVSDPEYEKAIQNIGWGGNVPFVETCDTNETDEGDPCIVSFLAINEANISVNKVNSFIRRKEKRQVAVSDTGDITEKIERTIINDSKGEAGSGTYTVYMRFLIPSSMSVTGFMFGDTPIPTRNPKAKTQILPYGELDNSIRGLTSVAVAIAIPPGEERTISLSFKHPTTLPDTPVTFLFTEQKQPGIDSVPSQFQLIFPKKKTVTAFENGVPILAKDGGFEYNSTLTSDLEIRATYR